MKPDARWLVLGATGALGGHLVEQLTKRGTNNKDITAAGRNQARLTELTDQGFATATVELSDGKAVAELVSDHSDIILISGTDPDRLAQHLSVIDSAQRGDQHIYYTSGLRADDPRHAINADHRATEEALAASGVTHTILRNTWYIENYLQSMPMVRRSGVLAAAVGQAVVAAASRRDLAEAIATVATSEGHENSTYSLSGDTEFTYSDIADAMAAVLGQDVTYMPVTADALRSQLVSVGMEPAFVDFLVDLDETIASGAFARVGDDLRQLIGRPSTGLVDALGGS